MPRGDERGRGKIFELTRRPGVHTGEHLIRGLGYGRAIYPTLSSRVNEPRDNKWAERWILWRAARRARESWLEIAKPARQVARELRSHLSQFRYPQPKKGVHRGCSGWEGQWNG